MKLVCTALAPVLFLVAAGCGSTEPASVSTLAVEPVGSEARVHEGQALGRLSAHDVRSPARRSATTASQVDYQGTELQFCCDGCVATFARDPATYVAKSRRAVSGRSRS